MEVSTERVMQGIYWGVEEETLGTPGAVRGHRTPLALQLPSPAMDIFGKCCVPLGEIWLLSRNVVDSSTMVMCLCVITSDKVPVASEVRVPAGCGSTP